MRILAGQEINNGVSSRTFKEANHVAFLEWTFIRVLPFDVVSYVVVRCFYLLDFEVCYPCKLGFELLADKTVMPAI